MQCLGPTPTLIRAWGDASPLKKMWGYNISYIPPPPSSRPITGSWDGACNDTERCNRHFCVSQNRSVKNTKFVVTTWVLSSSECTKTRPRWGSLRRSPKHSSRLGRGASSPHSPTLRRLDLAAIAPPPLLKEIYANVEKFTQVHSSTIHMLQIFYHREKTSTIFTR